MAEKRKPLDLSGDGRRLYMNYCGMAHLLARVSRNLKGDDLDCAFRAAKDWADMSGWKAIETPHGFYLEEIPEDDDDSGVVMPITLGPFGGGL